MPSHRAPKYSTRKTSAFAIAGVAAGSVLLMQPGAAQAETVQQAQNDYNQKMHESEAATEAYDAAQNQAAVLQKKVDSLQAQISSDTASMSALQRTMGLQAAQQYESGGMSQTMKLALDASPETYLNEALADNEISAKEAQLLKTLATDKAQVAQDQKLAATALSQQQAQVTLAAQKKSQALSQSDSAKTLLASLTASQRATIQQSQAGVPSTSVNITQVAPDSRAAQAVAYAKSKLGDEYVYAAVGPDTFDCSGLTMEAWASAGVSIERTAADQYDSLPHVSLSALEPGDLLFYDYGDGGITHVAIYVGNGMAIHAPHTGTVVQYGQINNIGPLVGAARP
jgi:cell wall-associated NlpC family hydrolase